jgi:hypothetical protein
MTPAPARVAAQTPTPAQRLQRLFVGSLPMRLESGLLARFSQGLEKILPVHIIQKNVFAPVPTAHQMANGANIFHSHFARRGSNPNPHIS